MPFNPLEHPGIPLDRQSQRQVPRAARPDAVDDGDPFTRCRVMTMHAIETEAALFDEELVRSCGDPKATGILTRLHDIEGRQLRTLRRLVPGRPGVLEAAVAQEQVSVDLTAWVARMEPDPRRRSLYRRTLEEDFDHLYRLANLYEMTTHRSAGLDAEDLVTMEPRRRSTIRPASGGTRPRQRRTAPPALSELHALTLGITQLQTTHFYDGIGLRRPGRRRTCGELGSIGHEHLTRADTSTDPGRTAWEELVMREYNECYLYHCFAEQETDSQLKALWEFHLGLELGHLHAACNLMRRQDGLDPSDILPPQLPSALDFTGNRDYLLTLMDAGSHFAGMDIHPAHPAGARFGQVPPATGSLDPPRTARKSADGHLPFGSARLFQDHRRPPG
ncbi:hypothetical protein [Streptomyces sp. NPDC057253]|uniref:hypothetical protein n=1 Tax=Streptomyces sp. NPDC057253 TaxID=3346069 RepID=UPI0036270060